jgi:hypothetical protein
VQCTELNHKYQTTQKNDLGNGQQFEGQTRGEWGFSTCRASEYLGYLAMHILLQPYAGTACNTSTLHCWSSPVAACQPAAIYIRPTVHVAESKAHLLRLLLLPLHMLQRIRLSNGSTSTACAASCLANKHSAASAQGNKSPQRQNQHRLCS